jgi:hypothetical protein
VAIERMSLPARGKPRSNSVYTASPKGCVHEEHLDATGAVAPVVAKVAVENEMTGVQRTLLTNSEGTFYLSLPAGPDGLQATAMPCNFLNATSTLEASAMPNDSKSPM